MQQLLQRDGAVSDRLILLAVLPAKSSLANQQIRSSLNASIDLSHCLYREQCTEAPSSYIIKSLATDSRTIVSYNSLPEMTANEFRSVAAKMSDGVSMYHFEV
jgi:ketohexokinase